MTIGELWRRVMRLVRGDSAADDLREETQLHIELRAEANRAGRGANGAEARAAASRQFGNEVVLREVSRDQWGFLWVDHLMRDARYATRRLVQRPGFSLAVVGVLALGIGATTATFSAVDAAMLRPLPFADPSSLVVLRNISVPFDPGGAMYFGGGVRSVEIGDVRTMPDVFSNAAVYAAGGLNLADPDHPARVNVGVVSGGFFETLGVVPFLGRTFAITDEVPHGPNVVVLSHGLWQREYGGSAMVGKSITLNNQPYTVVGVMPAGFGFPSQSDLWIPMSIPNTFDTFAAFRGFLHASVIARLAPGVTMQMASARLMSTWERRVAQELPPAGQTRILDGALKEVKTSGALAPLQQDLSGDRRPALVVLFGATLLLMLITCANVTNLLLSQASARRHEIIVRAVLGASRGRIARQLLTEAIILAATGTLLGVALAPALLGTMRALMPSQLNGLAPATVDLRVLGFAAGLALCTGVGFGLWPALGSTHDAASETIKTGGRASTGRAAGRVRRALVGVEVALTVVLLVGSLLMVRSFGRLMSQDRGMDTERVGTLQLTFGRAAGERGARLRKLDDILARLAAIPGVISVGVVNDLPLRGAGGISVQVKPDMAQPATSEFAGGRYLLASADYFATMGIPVKRGRTFTASDDSLAPRVAIVSESMAKRFWPGVDAIGHTFTMGPPETITIVGVVADVRERKLESELTPQMYFPVAWLAPDNVAIVVRSSLPADALLARMRESVRAVDRTQPVYDVRMMDDVVSGSVAPRRANTILISLFALLALALSALGVYAVVSYSVSQRTREFGIRAALGASGMALQRLVLGEMALVLMGGVAGGVAGAWALSKVLTSMIYGVSVHDRWTFAVAPLVLVAPVLLAAIIPASRATRVNPAEVMRAD